MVVSADFTEVEGGTLVLLEHFGIRDMEVHDGVKLENKIEAG